MRVNKEMGFEPPKRFYPQIKERECSHSPIVRLQVNKDKITAFLADKREISIPTAWISEKSVPLSRLEKYEIWDGYEIFWPELKEIIGIETFTEGLGACCDYH